MLIRALKVLLDFFNICPRALGRKVVQLSEYAFKLEDSPLPPRSAKFLKTLEEVCPGKSLKNLQPNLLSDALTIWNLDHFRTHSTYLANSTVRQAFGAAITHLKVVGYNDQLGSDIQRKAILDNFSKNLKVLNASQTRETESLVWTPNLLKLVTQTIVKIKLQGPELTHPMAFNMLPNIIIKTQDFNTIKACLLWVQLVTGLRSTEIYQISLNEMCENKHERVLNLKTGKLRLLVTYSRVLLHKTERLGVSRFTPIILACQVENIWQPTLVAKALAYLLKIVKIRTAHTKKEWDSPIPPTKQFIPNQKLHPYRHSHLTAYLKHFTKNDPAIQRVITANATRRTTILALAFAGANQAQIQQLTAWRDPNTLKIYLGKNLIKYREHQKEYDTELLDYFRILAPVLNIRPDLDNLSLSKPNLPPNFLEPTDEGEELL